MSTPREIQTFIGNIRSRGYAQLNEADYERLCELALLSLPQQCVRKGRKCPHCPNFIGNASRNCKFCKRNVSTGQATVSTGQATFVRPVNPNECSGSCALDLTGTEYIALSCGHKFCKKCMGNRIRRGFSTCCHCDRVDIPDFILSQFS